MENTENTTIETVETKPKRKHLLAEIERLKEEKNKLEAEIVSLKAYIAGIKGDAFPESEVKQ